MSAPLELNCFFLIGAIDVPNQFILLKYLISDSYVNRKIFPGQKSMEVFHDGEIFHTVSSCIIP